MSSPKGKGWDRNQKYSDVCDQTDRFCKERIHVSLILHLEADHIQAKIGG